MPRLFPAVLLGLVAASACGPASEEAPGPAPPPGPANVVLITLDTTRADALSAYGSPLPTSPRMEAMAAEGLLFEQAITSVPITAPSHATLFTGRQPYRHGVRTNGYRLSPSDLTLAEVLRGHGYRTHAEVAAPVLDSGQRLDQGFDTYRDVRSTRPVLDWLEAVAADESGRVTRPAEEITASALEALDELAGDPFFLWLHYFDPHRPWDPPEPFRSAFRMPYMAEIARVDHQVGLVLDRLEALGLRERTLVVLTADHGEGLGDHGEPTHSYFVYDTTMRVPLIFWGAPVVPRGERVASLVRLVDVASTVVDLLGLPVPEEFEGVSFRSLFVDPAGDLELVGYGESLEPALAFSWSPIRFARLGRWKYIHKPTPELYDVLSDPHERRDLVDQRPELAADLRRRLEELLAGAEPPPDDVDTKLDAEQLAQLAALGYVGGSLPAGLADERATLDAGGPDPVARADDLAAVATALGALMEGDHEQAVARLGPLAERYPDASRVLSRLAESLVWLGRDDEALPLLRRVVELSPESVPDRVLLGRLLSRRGDFRGAEAALRSALALEPCADTAQLLLADTLRRAGRYRERLAVLEDVDPSCPDTVALRNARAWALATSPDPALRDATRAVRLARGVLAELAADHPDYLDTLAAALAESGDFEAAVATQERVVALVSDGDVPPAIVASFRRHLAGFRAGEPVREP